KKNWLFLGITLLLSAPVFSGTIESFCQEVTKSHVEKKHSLTNSGKFLAKFLFAPSSLVTINKVSSKLPTLPQKEERIKFAFLLLPQTNLTPDEKQELRAIQKEQIAIRKKFKRKFHSERECLSFIKDQNLKTGLLNLNDLAPRFLELKQKEIEEISYKEQSSKKKYLRKKGWRVFDNLSLLEIHTLISKERPNDILFVTHASQEGKVYDSSKNPFPKMFFSQLIVDNLILYSCYGEESLEYYSFGDFNLFTASPTDFAEQFLSEAVPLQSLKSISKIKLSSIKRPLQKQCLLELPLSHSDRLGIFLNGFFLGALAQEISFPCSILKEQNSLEIYSVLKERHMGETGLKH